MLLYDTLLRHAAKHCRSERDHARFRLLAEAEVFELTNVLPLLPDWEQGRQQPISKRAPYPNIWAEWESTEPGHASEGGEIQWETGIHLVSATQSEIIDYFEKASRMPSATREELCDACEEWLVAMRYTRVQHSTAKSFRGMIGEVTLALGFTVFGFQADATVVRSVQMYPQAAFEPQLSHDERRRRLDREGGAFGLTLDLALYQDVYDPLMLPWPPLMAFALLHCRNVDTAIQTPAPQLNRQVQRRGHPPLASYHILQLHLQESRRQGQDEIAPGGLDQRVKRRFHLVRGHFKYLSHERFHEKGWHWWPAHWRGDLESGVVMKDYSLVP